MLRGRALLVPWGCAVLWNPGPLLWRSIPWAIVCYATSNAVPTRGPLVCVMGRGGAAGRDPTQREAVGWGGGGLCGPQNCGMGQWILRAAEVVDILFQAYGRGTFFCFTPCVYPQNTQNLVEDSKRHVGFSLAGGGSIEPPKNGGGEVREKGSIERHH